MLSPILLTVPAFEPLAVSNCASSSSSSSSLFSSSSQSSDSQTDCSPPHSPLKDAKSSCSAAAQRTPTSGSPLWDAKATPRQSSCKRTLQSLEADLDIGYESERESLANIGPIRNRTKYLTRKKGTLPGTHGLGIFQTSLDGEETCCYIPTERVRSLIRPCAAQVHMPSPSKPKILPVTGLDSPSPIFPLPSPSSYPACLRSPELPPKPKLEPEVLSNAVSPLVDLPASVKPPTRAGRFPSSHQTDLASVVASKGVMSGILGSPSIGNPVGFDSGSSTRTAPTSGERHHLTGFAATPAHVANPRKGKAIGLGLPSVLRPPKHYDHALPLVSTECPLPTPTVADEKTDSTTPASEHRSASPPASSSNHCKGRFQPRGIRLFKTYHFPKRRLYDIPESISPKRTSPKARTYAARGCPLRFDSGSWTPAAVGVETKRRGRLPLLDARKNLLPWLSSMSPTRHQRSPVALHLEAVQDLNPRTACEAQAPVLF